MKHWRYRYPLVHRIERRAVQGWDWLTWGPFYFVRRVVCYFFGHDEHEDDSTPEGFWYCRRCMKDTTDD